MNYCEEKGISISKLNKAQKKLYFIAEHMKMDKSISEEGYEYFQQAIKALEQEPCKDCISRQEVLRLLANSIGKTNTYLQTEVLKMPSVTPQSFKWCTGCKEYDQENHCCHRWSKVIRDTVEEMKQEYIKREVLDKLRAEIEQYQSDYDVHGTEYDRTAWKAFNRCLQIIDKYKAESENKE